jgi:hypothetical protein
MALKRREKKRKKRDEVNAQDVYEAEDSDPEELKDAKRFDVRKHFALSHLVVHNLKHSFVSEWLCSKKPVILSLSDKPLDTSCPLRAFLAVRGQLRVRVSFGLRGRGD